MYVNAIATGSGSVSAGNLLANTITMSDEERVILMERFKKQELSESEVLSKVHTFTSLCMRVHTCMDTLV